VPDIVLVPPREDERMSAKLFSKLKSVTRSDDSDGLVKANITGDVLLRLTHILFASHIGHNRECRDLNALF
jgi:hypothetical protein